MGNRNISKVKLEDKSSNLAKFVAMSPGQKSKENQVLKIVKSRNKESQDSKLISDCLMKHFFLRVLEKQARAEVVKEMSLYTAPKGTILYSQGDPAGFFYIIKDGTVESSIEEVQTTLQQGESFGELSLLFNCQRESTVKAITDCSFWTMEAKSFRKVIEHISHNSYEESMKFIQSMPVLNALEHEEKFTICNNLYKFIFEDGKTIFKTGELASCIYFIKSGEVNCVSNKRIVKSLSKGDYFGEREILLKSYRTMDAVVKTKCYCFALSVSSMRAIVGENYIAYIYLNILKNAFLSSKNFAKFNVKLLDQVFHMFKLVYHYKEKPIMLENYVCSSKMSVVVDGGIANGNTREVIPVRSTLLFEDDVLNDTKRKLGYSIIPSPDCLILEANMSEILGHFQSSFKELMDKSSSIERLKKVNLFKNFPLNKLEAVSRKIKIDRIANGKNVITQGEDGTRFFIIKSGKIDIFVKGKYIRTMNENEYLGERALFFKEPRSATATANGDVEVFYLEKDDFITTIQLNLKEYLMNRLYLQDNTVQLNDLDFYDTLGAGSYGNVSLVKNKKNNYFYAIKNISNKQILHEQLHKNLELERAILLQIDHPFIVKLVKTLKDQKNIYFLMEYIKGKELFDVIRDIGLLTKLQTQFYSASMMLAVEYLHQRKFIFRDIKPENIMVLANGYLKVIDFGTAKAIADKTKTIIGTPHYMAPEVILGEGYSFQVDYWSIAICMYEFMCGAVPFGEEAEEPMDVYLSVINE